MRRNTRDFVRYEMLSTNPKPLYHNKQNQQFKEFYAMKKVFLLSLAILIGAVNAFSQTSIPKPTPPKDDDVVKITTQLIQATRSSSIANHLNS